MPVNIAAFTVVSIKRMSGFKGKLLGDSDKTHTVKIFSKISDLKFNTCNAILKTKDAQITRELLGRYSEFIQICLMRSCTSTGSVTSSA